VPIQQTDVFDRAVLSWAIPSERRVEGNASRYDIFGETITDGDMSLW
jgi:hypothetical protein